MARAWDHLRRRWAAYFCAALALYLLVRYRSALYLALSLIVGAATLSFVLSPLVNWLGNRLTRSAAILTAYALVLLVVAGVVVLLLPPLSAQVRDTIAMLPDIARALRGFMANVQQKLAQLGLTFFDQPLDFTPGELVARAGSALGGAATWAGGFALGIGQAMLVPMLAYYFLRDRDELMLRMEMLVPQRHRGLALRMAAEIREELSVYVRGQVVVSLIVGVLTGIGLAVVGVRSFLLLGVVMAICNLIPYFGPFIGAIPILLLALGQSTSHALYALIVVCAMQQAEGLVIAPRVMGSTTGLNPALVLLTITVGSAIAGLPGLFFALPLLLIIRAALRILRRAEIHLKSAAR